MTLSVAKIMWVLVIRKWVKMENLWHVVYPGGGKLEYRKKNQPNFALSVTNSPFAGLESSSVLHGEKPVTHFLGHGRAAVVDSSWNNVKAHGDAREGKWRGNWRMNWVASTLHTTSEHGVSSITTADAYTSAASSRLNWSPRRFKWTRPFRRKTKSGFCFCAIIFQNAVYQKNCAVPHVTAATVSWPINVP